MTVTRTPDRRSGLRRLPLLVALSLAVCAAALVSAAGAGRQTTAPSAVVDVRVTLTDTRIVLSRNGAPRGTFARFIIRNVGTRPHTFTLGVARRGIGRQSGFSRTLRPGAQQILILFLDYRGRLPYFEGVASARTKPAMKGEFLIGACVSASAGCGSAVPG